MASNDVWDTIHAERQALVDDLQPITEPQWTQPTMCDGWSVRDVLAHMTATAQFTPPKFFVRMVGSGFSLSKLQAKDVEAARTGSGADALQRFAAEVGSSKHPPGPNDTWLGEAIIHAEDIRRSLGIPHDYPTDAVVRVADAYKGSNLVIGAKRRIAGVRLEATDTDWSHGDGPTASGPMLSVLLAMTGRKAALDDLSGDGVATLRSR